VGSRRRNGFRSLCTLFPLSDRLLRRRVLAHSGKSGEPGWGALIPIYNVYLWVKVAGRPGWWVLLFFVPVVSFFVTLILALDIARAFARSGGFGVGLFLLSFIFVPILGFGSSTYQGPHPTPLA
jgi:uncharacterized protein DUF5684